MALPFLLGVASLAVADPVSVSSGNVAFSRQNTAGMHFGDGDLFNLSAEVERGQSGTFDPSFFCNPCEGKTYNLSVHVSATGPASEMGSDVVFGTFMTADQRYTLTALTFDVLAGDIMAPGTGTVTSRFTFTGNASGTAENGVMLSVPFSGRGLVRSFYDAGDGWMATEYHFANAAQTPEPGSMLLLATGGLGLALRRRSAE